MVQAVFRGAMRQLNTSTYTYSCRSMMMMNVMRQPVMMPMMTRMAMPAVQYRMIHQRGYNNFNDVYNFVFHEINFALANAKHTDNIVFVYKKFGEDQMTPEQIMYGFRAVTHNGLEKTEDFWKVIVPLVKKQMATLDR